jgi:hypothetical protein
MAWRLSLEGHLTTSKYLIRAAVALNSTDSSLLALAVFAVVSAVWWRQRSRPRLVVSAKEITLPADGGLHRAMEIHMSGVGGALAPENVKAEGARSQVIAGTSGSDVVTAFSPVNPGVSQLVLGYRNTRYSHHGSYPFC